MKKILRLLIIGLMFFVFTGCHKEWQRLFDELEQIKRSGNYDIVGTIGIVNGLDRFHFVEEINRKLKMMEKKLKMTRVIRTFYFFLVIAYISYIDIIGQN